MEEFIGFVHESEIETALFCDIFFNGNLDFRASPEKGHFCGNLRFQHIPNKKPPGKARHYTLPGGFVWL